METVNDVINKTFPYLQFTFISLLIVYILVGLWDRFSWKKK